MKNQKNGQKQKKQQDGRRNDIPQGPPPGQPDRFAQDDEDNFGREGEEFESENDFDNASKQPRPGQRSDA